VRRGACTVFAVAALSGGSAVAGTPRLVVKPVSPVAGEATTIELRDNLKAPVYAKVGSPNGASSKVRLRRVAKSLWRGTFKFPYSGRWTVRARKASTVVLVRSPLTAPPPASTFTPPGASGCTPPSPANAFTDEARGTASVGDLWALLFADVRSSEAVVYGVVGKPTKIVWRLQGSGDATFTAIAPDGDHGAPTELKYHGDSIWNRPGVEWGSVFVFSQAGCWQIHAERGDNAGDLWLVVRS
jgi:hypothetical protein